MYLREGEVLELPEVGDLMNSLKEGFALGELGDWRKLRVYIRGNNKINKYVELYSGGSCKCGTYFGGYTVLE